MSFRVSAFPLSDFFRLSASREHGMAFRRECGQTGPSTMTMYLKTLMPLVFLFAALLPAQLALAVPPTTDPTYGWKSKGLPFTDAQPPADASSTDGYLKHLIIRPKSAQAAAGAAQFSGIKTLSQSRWPRVKILPNPSAHGLPPALLVDFGQELAGRLEVWGTAGADVSITTGESAEECVQAEPSLDNSGPFKLTLAGSQPVATPYSAFRYARLAFPGTAPVELTRVVCDDKYYPVQYRGAFNCSDPLLTRIWYAGAYTAHLCMQEEIWDAPKRDRGLWIGDLQVTGQTINNVFADKFLMERSIALVRDKAQAGRPSAELPVSDVNKLPGYSAAWFCTLADFYRHAGDVEFLARQHEKIVSLLAYQQTLFDTNDLFINPHKEWNYCDWSPGFVLDNPLTRATTDLYIIHGVHEAVYLLRALGDPMNAEKFAAWADQLTKAARAKFFTPTNAAYGGRLQMNIMAVLSGVATPAQAEEICSRVLQPGSPAWTVEPDRTRHDDDPITPYYAYFLLQAMSGLNQNQAALDFIRRNWGDMLRRGATTWWEKFDPAWPDDMKVALGQTAYLSLCHGWSTGPTTYLTENVLGVRPMGAGFGTVEIRPQLGDLTWAEGAVPTPQGLIQVRVERKKDRLTAVVKLPSNLAATILLPGQTLHADKAGTYWLAASLGQEKQP